MNRAFNCDTHRIVNDYILNKVKMMHKTFNFFLVKSFYPECKQTLKQFKSCPQNDRFVAEIILPYDPRAKEFTSEIEKEIEWLANKKDLKNRLS